MYFIEAVGMNVLPLLRCRFSECHGRMGMTLIEVLAAVGIVAVCLTLVLPALSNMRDDTWVRQCANNLRLLNSSAIAFSFDHRGNFFPHVILRDPDRDVQILGPIPKTRWFDENVVGQYVRGQQLSREGVLPGLRTDGNRDQWQVLFGLGGGVFICPSDAAGPARSYDFNVWASSLPASDSFARQHGGTFFDATAAALDRLILFADVVGTEQTRQGWATSGLFGTSPPSPGMRFGGTAKYSDSGYQPVVLRFEGQGSIAGDLDYVRHGENKNRALPVGAVNFALADGHVKLFRHEELYVPEDMGKGRHIRSTLNVWWSPADPKVQEDGVKQ